MLDIKYIRHNADEIKKICVARNMDVDVDSLLQLDTKRRAIIHKTEEVRAQSNNVAQKISMVSSNEERAVLIKEGSDLKKELANLEVERQDVENAYNTALLTIPNLLPEDTPAGEDDTANVAIRKFGTPPKFDFTPKDHLELGRDLDLIDFETGAKVAGSKFYYLKNEAALLSMALQNYVMAKAVAHGYTPMMVPDMARADILVGTGYQPRRGTLDGEIYCIEGHDLCMIGTAEIPLGGYHANQVLNEEDLPKKYVAFSHCFRTEAGAGGRANKGLYRVHQFDKVELFQFTKPEDSAKLHEEMVALEEKIFQGLELPYQLMHICAGDLGAPAYKKYDIEAWMPSKGEDGEYGEVTSASDCTAYQARRLNIKYKKADGTRDFVHTLNGTGVAVPRALIAIMENNQTADGEIIIPKVLVPFMGGIEKISKK